MKVPTSGSSADAFRHGLRACASLSGGSCPAAAAKCRACCTYLPARGSRRARGRPTPAASRRCCPVLDVRDTAKRRHRREVPFSVVDELRPRRDVGRRRGRQGGANDESDHGIDHGIDHGSDHGMAWKSSCLTSCFDRVCLPAGGPVLCPTSRRFAQGRVRRNGRP